MIDIYQYFDNKPEIKSSVDLGEDGIIFFGEGAAPLYFFRGVSFAGNGYVNLCVETLDGRPITTYNKEAGETTAIIKRPRMERE